MASAVDKGRYESQQGRAYGRIKILRLHSHERRTKRRTASIIVNELLLG